MKYLHFTLLVLYSVFSKAQIPPPVMSPLQGNDSVCASPSTAKIFTASASNAPTSYNWYVSPYINLGTTSSTVAINFPYSGATYTVYCTASNAAGTSLNTASMIVTVLKAPDVTFSGASAFCQGSSTQFQASPTIVSASSTIFYNWSPSNGLSSTTASSPVANPTTSTNYTVVYNIGSCSNTAQMGVTVYPLPWISYSFSTQFHFGSSACKDGKTQLSVGGTAATYSVDYVPYLAPITITNSQVGVFTYTISALSVNGCNNLTLFTQTVILCPNDITEQQNIISLIKVYPNPNNGNFVIQSTGPPSELRILNVTGQFIQSIQTDSSGTYEVMGLKPGVYFISTGFTRQKIIVLD